MAVMLRRFSAFVFIVAALLVAEPLLHNHPLQPPTGSSSTSSCAICATGVGRLPVIAPSVGAPQMVVYAMVTAAVTFAAPVIALSIASRAPPAA